MQKNKSAQKMLKSGKIGVIPTDTIYGVAASALDKKAVEKTFKILKRDPKKPFIVLISSVKDLNLFNAAIDAVTRKILKKIWPGKVSIILPVKLKKFRHLHRGTGTLAFRVPQKSALIRLLKYTGPLISSSANPEGKRPASTIPEAKACFGEKIDFYVSGGKMKSPPSTLVAIKNGKVCVIRKGVVKIPKTLL